MRGRERANLTVEKMSSQSVGSPPLLFRRIGYCLLLLMPVVSLLNIISIGTISALNIRPSDGLFLITSIVWILHTGMQLKLSKYAVGFLLGLGLLVIFPGFSSATSTSYIVDWPRWMRFIQTMMWGLYAIAFILTREDWDRFSNSIAFSGSILGGSSFVLYLIDPDIHRIAGFISASAGEEMDVQVSFNEIGALHALVVVLMVERWLGHRMSFFSWTALCLNVVGLVLIQSRSSYLAVMVFIFVYVALKLLKGTISFRLDRGILLGSVVFISFVLLINSTGHYLAIDRTRTLLEGLNDVSAAIRLSLWKLGFTVLGEADFWNLMFGYGSRTLTNLIGGTTLDNFYLDHLLSEGMCGLALILLLIFSPLAIRNANGRQSRIVAIWGVACVAMVVSLTGNVLVNPLYGAVTMIVMWGAVRSTPSRPV